MSDLNLEQAREVLIQGACELGRATAWTHRAVSEHLRNVSQRVLDLLDEEDNASGAMSEFERASADIAADLKRVERLMRRSDGQD